MTPYLIQPKQAAGGLPHLCRTPVSISDKGDCLYTAAMESLLSSLKTELVHRERFKIRAAAKAALFEYVAIAYNRQQHHSRLEYSRPHEARTDRTATKAA